MKLKFFLTLLTTLLFTVGCADKSIKADEDFNKPAAHWYNEIIKNIKVGDLDKADDVYASLASEHVNSNLQKEALLILSTAHSEKDEHIMARFYIDTYLTRYAQSDNIEYLKYLKLKSNFNSLKKANRDQKLIIDTIKNANNYIQKFPNSTYNPLVHTMLTKLYLAELSLNRSIAKLYNKTDKKNAAKIYEEKVSSSWLKDTQIDLSDQGILGKIFN